MVSVASIISAISDDKALSLFKAVALSKNDSTRTLITKLRLTSRQYYSIMIRLMRAGLVKRISGKYSLTSFGKVIFSTLVEIETVIIKYHWKLKVVDSIIRSANAELSVEECQRIIDSLIDNQEIKAILVLNSKIESHVIPTQKNKKSKQAK
jgi:hypothetical protein